MADENMKFEEILAIVKYKIANKIPMTTAREELMEEFLMTWCDTFGTDSVFFQN
jgi:hypothetical protein